VTEVDPFVGRVLAGRYEVLKKLNQGGVGAVYLAMQRPLDRPVALKVLLRKHADDPTAIKRFEKEAASVARLAHAHIVTVYDFGSTDDGDLFLAMEFLRGQSLRDLLDAAGWIPWERSLHILQGVTRALVAAHTQKIVHRDLKPENIMLVESNGDLDFAKVLDFGLARSIQGQGPQITRHDVIPGTPTYMSPERANGISDDPRSDLYALGAVWFELLAGEPPFTGETSIKVILRHVHETPRRPSQVQPHNAIPPFVDELVLQLLEKQPDRRPSSAMELLQRLDALARPAGWHVAGAGELARRGAHDRELATFSAAAAEVAATLADDALDLRFAAADAEPLPLTQRKPPPPTMTQEQPLLLTRRKATSLPPSSLPPSSTSLPPSSLPPSSLPPSSLPPSSLPPSPVSAEVAAVGLSSPLPAALGVPGNFRSLSTRIPTEEFLRLPASAQEASIAALHDSTANGIPARIESVAEVAGWLGTARTARAVGELCTAFLASRFERALVIDVRAAEPVPLGRAGFAAPAGLAQLVAATPGLPELASRREAYYGPSISTAAWMHWYGALGGAVPGAMFVAGLHSEGRLSFVFYADHRDVALRPDVKDTVVLLREAAGALSTVG
jgi:serine/threonine-protein kinase